MGAVLPQLHPMTKTDDCYRVLRQAILTLELAPGTPLIEGTIAQQLGVSKTPLREALAQLHGEGLIVNQNGRRSYVCELTTQSALDVLHVRMILEPAAIKKIAPVVKDSEIEHLADLVEQTSYALGSDDLATYITVGETFHSDLIGFHRNDYLSRTAHNVFAHSGRLWAALYREEQKGLHLNLSEAGVRNHQAIVSALRKRDGGRASSQIAGDIEMFADYIRTYRPWD